MIHLIDQMLDVFFRAEVPLPPGTDVSFATPDRTWGASISRPTINLFLWDVRRDGARSPRGVRRVRTEAGVVDVKPDPFVSLRYLITTWASEHRDEHQLLGSVMSCILRHGVVPVSHRPPGLETDGVIELQLATADERRPSEFWSSLDGQLKPGLEVEVAFRADVYEPLPTAPEVQTVETEVIRTDRATPNEVRAPAGARLRRTRRGGVIVVESVVENVDDPSSGA